MGEKTPRSCNIVFNDILVSAAVQNVDVTALKESPPNQTGPAVRRFTSTRNRSKMGRVGLQRVASQLGKRRSCGRALQMLMLLST